MNRWLVAVVASLMSSSSGNAYADVKAGEEKTRLCSLFCHNNGSHDGGLAPLLEGQPARYLYTQLQAFKEKRRPTGGMDVPASSMTDEDMHDISDYFAAQQLPATPFNPDPTKVALGRQSADELQCARCHQTDYKGRDQFPRLAGQWWDYTTAQLKDFRSGRRPHGTAAATDIVMNPDTEQSENLAHYFSQLK